MESIWGYQELKLRLLIISQTHSIMLGIVLIDFYQKEEVESLIFKLRSWSRLKCKIYLVSVGNSLESSFDADVNIEILATKNNLGYGGNNNLGIQKSKEDQNDWTLLLNNDIDLAENTIIGLLETLNHYDCERLFSFGPRIVENRNNIRYQYIGGKDISIFFNTRNDLITNIDEEKPVEVFYNIGACIFLNNKLLDNVGLLDETYFFSGEVADLCYRASKQGFKNIVFPSWTCNHLPQESSLRRYMYKYYSLRNRFLFIKKHDLSKVRYLKFIFFLLKDSIYSIVKLDYQNLRTNMICFWHVIINQYGNQNHKWKHLFQ